ncbi:hypothetical protein ACFXTI_016723 [Malus domestica]
MLDCLILTITDWADGGKGNPPPKQNFLSSNTTVQRQPKEKTDLSRNGQTPNQIPQLFWDSTSPGQTMIPRSKRPQLQPTISRLNRVLAILASIPN